MWFDDEERQDTTAVPVSSSYQQLWFDDEERQDTTSSWLAARRCSCGLMMKKDKIQPSIHTSNTGVGCGLMMKKDKIQQHEQQVKQQPVVV